jgi:hypothetical protein
VSLAGMASHPDQPNRSPQRIGLGHREQDSAMGRAGDDPLDPKLRSARLLRSVRVKKEGQKSLLRGIFNPLLIFKLL